jgi:hypothetical protein
MLLGAASYYQLAYISLLLRIVEGVKERKDQKKWGRNGKKRKKENEEVRTGKEDNRRT